MALPVHLARTMNASTREPSNLPSLRARPSTDCEMTVERSRADLIADGTVRLVDLVRPDLYAGETDAPTVVIPPPSPPRAAQLPLDADLAVDIEVDWDSIQEDARVADGPAPRTWGPSVSALRWARLGCVADRPMPLPTFTARPRTASSALRVAVAVLLAGAAVIGLSVGAASRTVATERAVAGASRSPRVPVTTHASRGASSDATERMMPESLRPTVRHAERRAPAKPKTAGMLDIL
jgi:hypothetical protein